MVPHADSRCKAQLLAQSSLAVVHWGPSASVIACVGAWSQSITAVAHWATLALQGAQSITAVAHWATPAVEGAALTAAPATRISRGYATSHAELPEQPLTEIWA